MKCRFRVLVVEDVRQITKQLLDTFAVFDDWEVESAANVFDAKRKIEVALEGRSYDAYTLDIELPEGPEPGGAAKITTDLHQYIRDHSPEALIAYCSGHLDHPLVRKQLAQPDPRTLIFNKRGTWMPDVVEELHKRLHSDPIRQEMTELFQAPLTMAAGRGRFDAGAVAGYSLTHKMSVLVGRIVHSWRYLDDQLKREIEHHFKAEEKDGKVTLRLY